VGRNLTSRSTAISRTTPMAAHRYAEPRSVGSRSATCSIAVAGPDGSLKTYFAGSVQLRRSCTDRNRRRRARTLHSTRAP
jgi:hypothetical protein